MRHHKCINPYLCMMSIVIEVYPQYQLLLTCCGNSPSSNCKLSKTFAARCRGNGSLSACNNAMSQFLLQMSTFY
jgi:hypothetical protein